MEKDQLQIELKAIISDILNKYLTYISSDALKQVVFSLIEKNYIEGLEQAELGFNMNFVPDYNTISFVQKFAFDNVTKLTDDLKDNLRKEVSLGLMNGEGIPALRERVASVLDSTIERAGVIAKTETNRAFNISHYQAAKDSGLVLKKQWNAQPERVSRAGNMVPCPICESLHNQTIGLSEKFVASNGMEYLLPPLHPNCACRVIYVQS